MTYLALEILSSCLAPVRRANGWVVPNVGNGAGLVRLLSYEIRSGAPAAARANALAELADWHVLAVPPERRRFERYDELALAFYERAYRELQQSGDLQTSMQMFAPELPVTLPTFGSNPFASAASAESPRYIDVAFAVTKYGTGEQIEILDTSSRCDAHRGARLDSLDRDHELPAESRRRQAGRLGAGGRALPLGPVRLAVGTATRRPTPTL